MAMIAEGVETTRAAAKLAKLHNVEMPITNEVYQVLFENKPAIDTVNDLMTRELKKEVYSYEEIEEATVEELPQPAFDSQ